MLRRQEGFSYLLRSVSYVKLGFAMQRFYCETISRASRKLLLATPVKLSLEGTLGVLTTYT